MKKSIFLFLCLIGVSGFAQKNHHQTYTYFQNDTLQLELDVFLPKGMKAKPLVIFVHGGGFANGNREAGHQFCKFLAENDIAGATITYSLSMKDRSFSCDGILTEKIKAIQLAANQIWQATSFFIENHNKFDIDPDQIFLAGYSAGGEAILHAAYWDRAFMGMYPLELSPEFRYAGIVSAAGAIRDVGLITTNSAVPSMLMHGTCDGAVPYDIAPHHYCKGNVPGYMMLFGSHAIHEHMLALNRKSFLISYCGEDHSYTGKAFSMEADNILWFIRSSLGERNFQMHSIVPTGKECERSAAFDFCSE